MSDFQRTNTEQLESNKKIISTVLKKNGKSKIAKKLEQTKNQEEFLNVLETNLSSTQMNEIIGNTFVFIAEQKVYDDEVGSIVGEVHLDEEDLNAGGGISIIDTVPNAVGITTANNYSQALESGESMGGLLFGSNQETQAPLINYTVSAYPLSSQINTPGCYQIQQTIPLEGMNFSAQSETKMNQILEIFRNNITKAYRLQRYNLGNLLFKQLLPKNTVTDVGSDNIKEWLENTFVPTVLEMERLADNYNAGEVMCIQNVNCAVGQTTPWGENLGMYECGGVYNIAPNSYNGNVLNNGFRKNATIYMSPRVSAKIMALFQIPSVLPANLMNLNVKGERKTVTEIMGYKVIATGTEYKATELSPIQGTAPTLYPTGQNVLSDELVVFVDDDYVKNHMFYDKTVESGIFTKTLTKSVTRTVQSMVVARPYLNGVTFYCPNLLNDVQFEVNDGSRKNESGREYIKFCIKIYDGVSSLQPNFQPFYTGTYTSTDTALGFCNTQISDVNTIPITHNRFCNGYFQSSVVGFAAEECGNQTSTTTNGTTTYTSTPLTYNDSMTLAEFISNNSNGIVLSQDESSPLGEYNLEVLKAQISSYPLIQVTNGRYK